MTARAAKILLVLAVALFYTFVVFDNLLWRALNNPAWHTAFYISIICWESIVMLLCWAGSWRMLRQFSSSGAIFERAKRLGVAALALALLMWLVAFLSVGGEWFLMWQSKTWNGQDAAFRMFTVIGIVLLLLMQPENEKSN